ncbi:MULTISPECIES: AAA family ATPase [unclassified Nitratiruptor]|uniref:AAA family ATPase n=1 Tax=unclassified Nitratiruptor TaxID=2624044 RepID=UPI0019157BDE|nr:MULTISPECIES: AAA family ATPase [unclassified Nitratiruptor]BCD60213.1 cell division protease FtsH [Nitratiruptor sp. YY08-10]BCD64298.1 hypothetical protein NitYY0814_C1143 [Nitratiruptor sp. YY08-14]
MKHKDLLQRYEELRKRLKSKLFGQDDAIDELIKALFHIHHSPIDQPFKGLFTFFGPHNSGKVYLATLLEQESEEFQGIKVVNMAEFTDPADQKKLIGENGTLPTFVHAHPQSIIVFKDIEKCDNVIQLALMNYIFASKEERGVDCSNVLFIFTSTLGSSLIKKEDFQRFYKKDPLKAQAKFIEFIAKEKKIIYDIVESAIVPELLSVIVQNYIILFKPLEFDSIVKIAKASFKETIQKSKIEGIEKIALPKNDFIELLVLSFSPYINARRVHKKLPDFIIDLIYQAIIKAQLPIKKIVFEVSDEAKQFLEKVDKKFLENLIKQNRSVHLSWSITTQKNIVTINIQKATLFKLPLYIEPTQKPYMNYSTISFNDIAGQKHVKSHLKEIVRILKHPSMVERFHIPMPKGMLLHGPKGVGKTLLAYAFIKETELPYVMLTGSDLLDTNLIHAAYQKAKEIAPAVVFLDELDGKDGMIIPYDAISEEIDAISDEEYVFTIATALNIDAIDKNLLASERFDFLIEVPDLDMEARKFFIKKILQKPNDGKIDIDKVARYMSGLSGYEMQRVGKEAALYVIRKNLKVITEEILIEQINNIKYGQKIDKKRIRNLEKDLHKTAYHEAGHAVVSYLLLPDIKIEQVTITPRAEALGFVSYTDEFITNISKEELYNDICVALAGRLSKLKKFPQEGEDTGAAQDLEQATWEAYNLVATFGMDESLGYIHIDTLMQNVSKELFNDIIEERVAYWIEKATNDTIELIETHWEKIEKVASTLIEKEMIDGAELKKIMES